jgi:sphingolipid delta-4 desaturase
MGASTGRVGSESSVSVVFMSAIPHTETPVVEELRSQADDAFQIRVGEFMTVDYAEPHLARGRRLLKRYPQIASLFGRNPWTMAVALFCSGGQVAVAWALVTYQMPWWTYPLAAFLIGALFCNCNNAVIHDASHDRVFRPRWANELTAWVANLPTIIPVGSSFRIFHMKHHRFQGDPALDADMASETEANFFGNSFFGKLAWQFAFPIVQSYRTSRFAENKRIDFFNRWVAINWVVQFAFDALIVWWLGWAALGYFALSFVFSLGPHPVGARYVQEHFIFHRNQETYSYYGPMNLITLNVYHHNEHHDFPAVPWSRLPELRRMVPEVYGQLYAHRSLTALWFKFLFDPTISLHRRIVRHYEFDGAGAPSVSRVSAQRAGAGELAADAAE